MGAGVGATRSRRGRIATIARMTAPRPAPSDPSAATLRRSRFNLGPLVYGQSISLLGDQIALFSLLWMVIELTGRERDLGLTAAAETAPMLLFGLAAGVVIDRVVLRRSLIAADLIRAAMFLLLAAAVAFEAASVWMVFAVAFLAGTAAVFFDSGFQALLPAALGDDLLVTANTRLQFSAALATVIGPPVAGLLIAGPGGLTAAFVVNAATFFASAIFLLFVKEVRSRRPADNEPFGRALRAGLRFLWGEPRLRWGTAGATAANFAFAPIAATLLLYVTDRLGLEGRGAGLFFGFYGALGTAGVLLVKRVIDRLQLGRTVVLGLVTMGAGFVVVSWTATVWVAAVAAGVALAGLSWINVAFTTLRQRLAPIEVLGRVVSASRAISWSGIPAGAALGGFVADAIGLITLFRISAFSVIGVGLVLMATPLWTRPMPAQE